MKTVYELETDIRFWTEDIRINKNRRAEAEQKIRIAEQKLAERTRELSEAKREEERKNSSTFKKAA